MVFFYNSLYVNGKVLFEREIFFNFWVEFYYLYVGCYRKVLLEFFFNMIKNVKLEFLLVFFVKKMCN